KQPASSRLAGRRSPTAHLTVGRCYGSGPHAVGCETLAWRRRLRGRCVCRGCGGRSGWGGRFEYQDEYEGRGGGAGGGGAGRRARTSRSGGVDAGVAVVAPRGVPLRRCLELAERNHPNIFAARARLRGMRGQLDEARFTPFSQFTVTGGLGLAPTVRGTDLY